MITALAAAKAYANSGARRRAASIGADRRLPDPGARLRRLAEKRSWAMRDAEASKAAESARWPAMWQGKNRADRRGHLPSARPRPAWKQSWPMRDQVISGLPGNHADADLRPSLLSRMGFEYSL